MKKIEWLFAIIILIALFTSIHNTYEQVLALQKQILKQDSYIDLTIKKAIDEKFNEWFTCITQ